MADQTVRTIYEAVVTRAQANLGTLARSTDKAADSADKLTAGLEKAGNATVSPEIDVSIKEAEAEVKRLTKVLDDLDATTSDPVVEADIRDSEAKIEELQGDLEALGRMEASPQVEADTARAEAQIEGLQDRIEGWRRVTADATLTVDVDKARSDLDDAEARLRALQGAKAEMVLTVDAEDVEPVLVEVQGAAEDSGESSGEAFIGGFTGLLRGGGAAGALKGAGAAAGLALGAAMIKGTLDYIATGFGPGLTEDVFGARAGVDEATARKYGAAAGEVYASAWGDSVEANLDTAFAARENGLIFDDATQKEIEDVTAQLTAVSDILGEDVTSAAEAAGNMVKNGLADNAEEAFDIILTGSQQGLNRSGDLLDTLREYSPMFGDLGLSGEEALGLINQGMEAGARNSDVLADGFKELSIRAQDGSAQTAGAFEDLGLNADEMGQAFARGGDDAKGALDTTLDALRAVEDPLEQNRLGVLLLGTMWEDAGNGAGFLAMDLDNLSESWINTGDTAEDAMNRMGDNAATKLEETKRTIENTLTSFAGGMASAWEGPLMELNEWILGNRATIVQFVFDLQAGFFDTARAVVEFGATVIDVAGEAAGALAIVVDALGLAVEAAGLLSNNQGMVDFGREIQSGADSMRQFSEDADGMAETMRTDVIGALDEAEAKMTSWSGPVLLRAQLDDAIYGMTSRLDEFSAHVDDAGGTVTINGETLTAEEALNALIGEVDASDGTVDINGRTVPADQALDVLVEEIDTSNGTVTVHGNTTPAYDAGASLMGWINSRSGTVDVGANTGPARDSGQRLVGYVNGLTGTLDVNARTGAANAAIDAAAAPRYATIFVRAQMLGGAVGSLLGRADGGRIAKGLAHGGTVSGGYGMVPAPYPGPGIDNVLWPLKGAATGRKLSQPLAGGEWVVNPVSSAQHDRTLAAINAGASRAEIAATLGGGRQVTYSPTINGPDAQQVSALSFGKFQQWAALESTGHHP